MKTVLVAVKMILIIVITVSIGSVLGTIGYLASIKNFPPIIIQPTIAPTITLAPNIDISDWNTYKNEKYGYKIKYPKAYSVKDNTFEITGGDDPSGVPWYFRNDYILNYIEFRNSSLDGKVAFTLETVNTIDLGGIMNIGNENIRANGNKKIKNFDVYLYSIDSGFNNMQVIFHNGKAYRFIHYFSDKNFTEIISTFEFIN